MGDGHSRVAAFVPLLPRVGSVFSSPFFLYGVHVGGVIELLMSRLSFVAVTFLGTRLYCKGIVPLSCMLGGPLCGLPGGALSLSMHFP